MRKSLSVDNIVDGSRPLQYSVSPVLPKSQQTGSLFGSPEITIGAQMTPEPCELRGEFTKSIAPLDSNMMSGNTGLIVPVIMACLTPHVGWFSQRRVKRRKLIQKRTINQNKQIYIATRIVKLDAGMTERSFNAPCV